MIGWWWKGSTDWDLSTCLGRREQQEVSDPSAPMLARPGGLDCSADRRFVRLEIIRKMQDSIIHLFTFLIFFTRSL